MERSRKRPGPSEPSELRSRLKSLPAVSRLLAGRPLSATLQAYGARLVGELLRERLDELRSAILDGQLQGDAWRDAVAAEAIAAEVAERARSLVAPSPRAVINGTGIVVHTNLGRSILSLEAAEQVAAIAQGYVDLEYDIEGAGRGSRLSHLEPLMSRLFPGRSFIAVNNNAAAILLCLRALSKGKDVVISRGELVEIGGSFRVPDILSASGAKLHEVGTTNRTRLSDYRAAIGPQTGLILKVHTSNFRIVGFAEETPIPALSELARENGLPLVVDWGSGDLVDLEPLGIHDELPVNDVLAAGADLVTFSGDKLLGGPQAGIVVGREDLIARLRSDPMARVCRLDRLLVAALQRTLAAYVCGREFEQLPTLRMLALSADEIGHRAERMRQEVADRAGSGYQLEVIDGLSRTGGGSSPSGERPTRLLAVGCPDGDAARLERAMRLGDPPVITRMQDGRLLIDLRTVLETQDAVVSRRLTEALEGSVRR